LIRGNSLFLLQWADFTAEYLQNSAKDQTIDLCGQYPYSRCAILYNVFMLIPASPVLLLKHIFSSSAIETSLIHSYLQYAVLQTVAESGKPSHNLNTHGSLIPISTFLDNVNKLPRSTISQQPHQWSVLLKIINVATADLSISAALKTAGADNWMDVADNFLTLLSDIVANGLYQSPTKADDNESELQDVAWQTNMDLRREQSSLLVPTMTMPNASSMSFDPEATFDLDMLEGTGALEDDDIKPVTDYDVPQLLGPNESQSAEVMVWHRNAILAADVFLKCLADEDVMNMLKGEGSEGLWVGDSTGSRVTI
jgi:hypothetical protein